MIDPTEFLRASPTRVDADLGAPVHWQKIGDKVYGERLDLGISFVCRDGVSVSTVHLHSDGHEGYKAYAGPLPYDLQFEMSQFDARAKLGQPVVSAPLRVLPELGPASAFDRFAKSSTQLHLEYSLDLASIRLITLMTEEVASNLGR